MARKGIPFRYRRKGGTSKPNGSQKQNLNEELGDSTSSQNHHDQVSRSLTVTITSESTENTSKHFHCYLLRSLDVAHPHMTYIGFTTNPYRRIRQHNGDLKKGGARRTRISGRPWKFVLVLHGFKDNTTALQFEWAWQHPNKSKAFKDALGEDAVVAGLLYRRRGIEAKMNILRILLCHTEPYCRLPLTLYFLEQGFMSSFTQLLQKSGANLSPSRKNTIGLNSSNTRHLLPSQMTMQTVGSLEELPFFAKTRKKKGSATNFIGSEASDSDSCASEDVNHSSDEEDNSKSSDRDFTDEKSLKDLSTHLLHISMLGEDDCEGSTDSNNTIYLSDSYKPEKMENHDVIILSDDSSYHLSEASFMDAYTDRDEDSCGTVNLISSPDQYMDSPVHVLSIHEPYPTHPVKMLAIVDLCSP